MKTLNFKYIAYLVLVSTLILGACKKKGCTDPTAINYSAEAEKDDGSCEYDNSNDDSTLDASESQLKSFFNDNESSSVQSFTIDAASPNLITGNQGTTLQFYANSFVDANGNDITGNIDIELIEIYEKKDMIFLNKQTLGDNGTTLKPLVSGGEFKVSASQNGNAVYLKPYYQYQMNVQAPNGTDPSMQVFYQNSSSDDTLTWAQADSSLIFGNNNVYETYFDSLGWVNCDYFMQDPGPFTTLDVEVPQGLNANNCALFISFDGLNSMTSIYQYQNGIFTTDPYYELPVGLNIHIIALAFINNTPHAAIVPATLVANHLEVISTLNATTPSQLATDIQNLP